MFGAPSSCALHDLSGNPEETLEEELQPKRQQEREMFEGAKENHLGSERVGVSVLETPPDELPSREQEFAPEDVEEVAQERSITKDKDIVPSDYSSDLQTATSCSEENPLEAPGEGVLLETNNSDVVEMESRDMLDVCSDDTKESRSISEKQKEPQSKEEAGKDETEETSTRTQASGKKKKKKKRAKKKGVHEEEKQQAKREKCSEEANAESTATGDVTEPVNDGSISEAVEDGSTGRAEDQQERNETEEVQLRTPTDDEAETSETVNASTAPERLDHLPAPSHDGKNDELHLEVRIVEAAVEGVEICETPRDSRAEAEEEERDDGPGLQAESVDALEAVEPSGPSDSKPAESRRSAREEQHDDEETPKTEERSEASSVPEDSDRAESGRVEEAGEDGHAEEVKPNCTNMEAEESDSEAVVLTDPTPSTHPSDGEDGSSACPPAGDRSESEPPSQPSAGADHQEELSEERDEGIEDGEDRGEESSPPTPEPQPEPAEEPEVDSREAGLPSEPSCSSAEEKSESLAADVECEKSLEAAEEAELLADTEKQEFLWKDQTHEAFSDPTKMVDNPDSPAAGALYQGPGEDQEDSKAESAALEDSGHKTSPNDQLSGAISGSCEGRHSAQPNLQESEDDDEGGQSFEFDDIDVEMADTADGEGAEEGVEEGAEEGVEVCSDGHNPGSCQSSTHSQENTSRDPEEDECVLAACPSLHTQDTAAVTVQGDASETPPEEDGTGLLGSVTENTSQVGSPPVEEGLDALQQLQGGDLLSEKSPDLEVRNTEPPQASKEVKKNNKKGKAKGKEDCKMS